MTAAARREPVAIGIDVGTSGVRAAAMTAAGAIVAHAGAPLPPSVRDGQRVEQTPDAWWQAMVVVLADVIQQLDGAAMRAIAIDGTSGTVLGIDASGTPIGPARMYDDAAAPLEAAQVAALAPASSAARGATSALARAMQLTTVPGTARVLHQADWLAGRLSGMFGISDENNALKTGYDPVTRQWPAWIGELGAVYARLPRVVPAGTRIGTVLPVIAARFRLETSTAIVTGTTDGCASFLATGATLPGEAATALGTTLVVKMLSDKPLFAPEYGLYSHRIGDLWLAGGASNSGGAVLAQYFSGEQLRQLEARLDPDRPTGLDYYPLLQPGERFPIANPALLPRLTPRPADDARFLQGLLEGIAAIERLAYDRLATLGAPPLTAIRNTGGGAANTAWTAIRSRIMGVPIVPAVSEMAAAGTARLAWQGIGHSIGAGS